MSLNYRKKGDGGGGGVNAICAICVPMPSGIIITVPKFQTTCGIFCNTIDEEPMKSIIVAYALPEFVHLAYPCLIPSRKSSVCQNQNAFP